MNEVENYHTANSNSINLQRMDYTNPLCGGVERLPQTVPIILQIWKETKCVSMHDIIVIHLYIKEARKSPNLQDYPIY